MGIYITIVSIIAFIMFGIDKYRAKYNYWRIKELTLLCLAALGGAIGAMFAMFVFRHKIRKPQFMIGIPALIVIQVVYCIFLSIK